VEDEPDLAEAVARGLRRHGYAVDIAFDGEQGRSLATVYDYDLIVLDLNLPGLDGLEVCREVRRERPAVLVLMLTASARPADRVLGLNEGADDYLVKPFHFEELVARVGALLRRDLRVRTPVLSAGDLRLDPAARLAWRNRERLDLTGKEFGVLEYLMRRPGEVVSQEALLEHVWDANANPFTNTVRVHINSLRRRLGDDAASPRYLETLPGQGYRLLAATPRTPRGGIPAGTPDG